MSAAGAKPEPVNAATVILVRDTGEGLETLMLRRNSKLAFVGGMWVFPGGRLDPGDWEGVAEDDLIGASRRACVREAMEESGLAIDESSLVGFAHWTPPAITTRRFLTWFFIARAPEGEVVIDQGEIHDDEWMRPADALRRRDAQEIELAPPTFVSLDRLGRFANVDAALDDARNTEPETFITRIGRVEGGVTAMWHGDAGYVDGNPDKPGGRHRLWMVGSGWRYERT